jgi:hypothetical protein
LYFPIFSNLVDRGHLYIKEKQIEEKIFWKCEQSRNFHCRARLRVIDEIIRKRISIHNHAGDAARIGAAKVVEEVKKRASDTQDGSHRIVTEAYRELPRAIVGKMPPNGALKKAIQNLRNREARAPPNPTSLEDLVIPFNFQITHKNEQFLLFDSDDGPNRILIFSTRRNLQLWLVLRIGLRTVPLR